MKDEKINLPAGEFLCDRAQKITEALYRVTDLFSDKEPLKWQLRDNAVELFDFLMIAEEKEMLGAENIFYSIRKMSRLLQLAYSSSAFFSSMNFEVLRREYLSLSDSFENQLKRKKEEIDSNGHSLTSGFDSNGQHLLSNGHNGQSLAGGEKEIKESKELKETEFPIGNSVSKSNGQPLIFTPLETRIENTAGAKSALFLTGLKERKRRILGLIKEGEWISIREISTSLLEFSPKSIQRDLLEMVDSGILKKIGDKRWRKYSFA